MAPLGSCSGTPGSPAAQRFDLIIFTSQAIDVRSATKATIPAYYIHPPLRHFDVIATYSGPVEGGRGDIAH